LVQHRPEDRHRRWLLERRQLLLVALALEVVPPLLLEPDFRLAVLLHLRLLPLELLLVQTH
jgi:hypothetical protein